MLSLMKSLQIHGDTMEKLRTNEQPQLYKNKTIRQEAAKVLAPLFAASDFMHC